MQGLAEKTLHGLINRCQNFFDHLPAQVSDQTFQRKSATGKAATPDAHLCGVVVAIVSRPHRRWTICFHLHQDGEAEQCCQKLMRDHPEQAIWYVILADGLLRYPMKGVPHLLRLQRAVPEYVV